MGLKFHFHKWMFMLRGNEMPGLYDKTEEFVENLFKKAGREGQIRHFKRTVYWIKQLRPNADEALLISAIAHDIERARRKKNTLKKKIEKGFLDKEFLRLHENEGAKIIAEFLKEQKAGQKIIERVVMLVSKHEEGGNEDQNLLKDADSISFFETSINYFLSEEKLKEIENKGKIRAKIEWMYERISSNKAKHITKTMYEEAITKFESL